MLIVTREAVSSSTLETRMRAAGHGVACEQCALQLDHRIERLLDDWSLVKVRLSRTSVSSYLTHHLANDIMSSFHPRSVYGQDRRIAEQVL